MIPPIYIPYSIPSRCANADVGCSVKDPQDRWVCSRCRYWAKYAGVTS